MAKKGTYAVIGIGRFGTSICEELVRLGHDVIAIDNKPEAINSISSIIENAVIMDSTNKSSLEEIDIKSVDHVIIAIGEDERASILTTLILNELGVKKITVKAQSEYHYKVIDKIGATEIIQPEQEAGKRLARRITSKNLSDYIEISSDYSFVEVKVNDLLIGKTLEQLDLRKKYEIHVSAIKRNSKLEILLPTDPILDGDVLLIFGENNSLKKFDVMMSKATK